MIQPKFVIHNYLSGKTLPYIQVPAHNCSLISVLN